MNEFVIDISDRQSKLVVDDSRLREAVRRVLSEERISAASINLALVDDAEIQRINREFLGHDYPTDVISFLLDGDEDAVKSQAAGIRGHNERKGEDMECTDSTLRPSSLILPPPLDGELIVSTETALREAAAHGWAPQDELLLYVVHGMLHLCGYDDLTDETRPTMRLRERQVLAGWCLVPSGLET